MGVQLRIFLSICALLFFVATLYYIRCKGLDLYRTILWFSGAAVLLILAIFPKPVIALASLSGVETPSNFVFLVLIGFLGGKILYVFTNWQNFLHEPLQYLGSSGFVVYGGILAGLAAAWSYCRRREVAFSAALDVFLPPVALAQAFGRVGCFLTGCCYGRPTQSRIGVVFPEGCSAPAGVPLIPTQLFSAAGDLLIVCLLLVYERRKAAYRTLAPTYFFLYGTGRFCIEFLRDDPRGSVGALSTSQFISVFVVILSAVLYWWEGRKHQKAASHP